MIVLDASAALELLLRPGGVPNLENLLEDGSELAYAPHLIDIEVAQVLRRLLLRREANAAQADGAMRALHVLPVERLAHGPLLDRIWELKAKLTAYDAAYVALAEYLDAPLWTRDARLSSAAGHGARIRLL